MGLTSYEYAQDKLKNIAKLNDETKAAVQKITNLVNKQPKDWKELLLGELKGIQSNQDLLAQHCTSIANHHIENMQLIYVDLHKRQKITPKAPNPVESNFVV